MNLQKRSRPGSKTGNSLGAKSSIPICNVVAVKLLGEVYPGELVNSVIEKGSKFGNLEITYCFPEICRVSTDTLVKFSEGRYRTEVIYEDDQDIVFLVSTPFGERIHVINRDSWNMIKHALERFDKGSTVGILLFGPPGTGKSSFVEILRGLYGVDTVEITPSRVLRPLLGESEKALESAFDEAKSNAPCILFIDECDVFFTKSVTRSGVSGPGEGTEKVYQSLRNIFLRRLPEIHMHRPPILILAATNASAELLDEAYRRAGRFDVVVYVTNPTWREIYLYLKFYSEHIDPSDVEKICKIHDLPFNDESIQYLSKLIANYGLSMADVSDMMKNPRNVRDVAVSKKSLGYRRLISLYSRTIKIADIFTEAMELVSIIRDFYVYKRKQPPSLVIKRVEYRTEKYLDNVGKIKTHSKPHLFDHRYILLPLLVHLFTEEGIPIVYVHELSPHIIKEAMLTAYESRGLVILDVVAVKDPTALPEIANIIAHPSAPLLTLNVHSLSLDIAEDITDMVMQNLLGDIVSKCQTDTDLSIEIVTIYSENLEIKLPETDRENIAEQVFRSVNIVKPVSVFVDLVDKLITRSREIVSKKYLEKEKGKFVSKLIKR